VVGTGDEGDDEQLASAAERARSPAAARTPFICITFTLTDMDGGRRERMTPPMDDRLAERNRRALWVAALVLLVPVAGVLGILGWVMVPRLGEISIGFWLLLAPGQPSGWQAWRSASGGASPRIACSPFE
jgi:hypothetical protein